MEEKSALNTSSHKDGHLFKQSSIPKPIENHFHYTTVTTQMASRI